MSSSRNTLLALCLTALAGVSLAQGYPGVGRPATAKEIAAWDIDVRPDFKGLPPGSGSVDAGQAVWEAKCAECHGVFGESNEVFSPIIGGTTADDIKTGHVASLRRTDYPGRTTIMKVATVSTLWDYINRAMPWTAPKSLKTDEVYAVTAYLLNLADIVPADFVLTNQNIASVQQRMPNRNGMSTAHTLWPGKAFGGTTKTDTANVACMKNCSTEVKLASMLPEHARNAHGNLAEQNRLVGQQHGVNTSAPEGGAGASEATAPRSGSGKAVNPALALIDQNGCTTCHAIDHKVVGPAFADVAKKYPGKANYLAAKIRSGGSGIWGGILMPPQTAPDGDVKTIADWLAAGAAR